MTQNTVQLTTTTSTIGETYAILTDDKATKTSASQSITTITTATRYRCTYRTHIITHKIEAEAAFRHLVDLANSSNSLHHNHSAPSVVVGLDAEGVNLARYGQLTVLQISVLAVAQQQPSKSIVNNNNNNSSSAVAEPTPTAADTIDVYLVDPVSGPKELISEGVVKELLEHDRILKVIHDCRRDSEALFHQFGVRLRYTFDTQVAYRVIETLQQHKLAKNQQQQQQHGDSLTSTPSTTEDLALVANQISTLTIKDLTPTTTSSTTPTDTLHGAESANSNTSASNSNANTNNALSSSSSSFEDAIVFVPDISLVGLLEKYCGMVYTEKSVIRQQVFEDESFWEKRPLTPAMIESASMDVAFLHGLYREMEKRMHSLKHARSVILQRSDLYAICLREVAPEVDIEHQVIEGMTLATDPSQDIYAYAFADDADDDGDKSGHMLYRCTEVRPTIGVSNSSPHQHLLVIHLLHGNLGLIIGQKGAKIKLIRETSRCDVFSAGRQGPFNVLYLLGNQVQISRARSLLPLTIRLCIPKSLSGVLIGRSGSVIRMLEEASGARIRFREREHQYLQRVSNSGAVGGRQQQQRHRQSEAVEAEAAVNQGEAATTATATEEEKGSKTETTLPPSPQQQQQMQPLQKQLVPPQVPRSTEEKQRLLEQRARESLLERKQRQILQRFEFLTITGTEKDIKKARLLVEAKLEERMRQLEQQQQQQQQQQGSGKSHHHHHHHNNSHHRGGKHSNNKKRCK